jgi:hypothetical protein
VPLPAFVGAGTGTLVETGPTTVSKTDCTAGNLLLLHVLERGTPTGFTRSNRVNMTALNGTVNSDAAITSAVGVGGGFTSRQALFACRATANGTVSWDLTVGGGGFDLLARAYEFWGGTAGLTDITVLENGSTIGSPPRTTGAGTSTSVADAIVTTKGAQRLALQFVVLESNQAIGNFSGETGGDWTEAVAEYAEAGGATGTIGLQIAEMPIAGVIDGGTITVTSIPWGTMGTAIIPLSTPAEDNPPMGISGRGAGW